MQDLEGFLWPSWARPDSYRDTDPLIMSNLICFISIIIYFCIKMELYVD